MKFASIWITQQTAFCDAILFSLAFALHWCCMITESHFVSFASGTHLKKKKIHQNKVTTQTSCFGFFQKPVAVQSVCPLTSRKRLHKAVLWYRNAHYAQRSWHSSEKHERKRLFLRTKNEQLSWALCLTEYGSSLYAKLEHYTNLPERLRLYFVHSAFRFHFFLSWSLTPPCL